MLSLAELGVSTAINFSLYKPIADKNKEKISSLMSFYKNAYRIIGCVVVLLGIILIPFLHYFIKNIESISNVYLIYILYLINTASTYFITYKETLINADQNKYKLAIIDTVSVILLNLLQIIFLIITKNFIIYLIVQFVVLFLQRVITNRYITKKYKNIDFNSKVKLDNEDKTNIVKNVKAMFFHKIGEYCINSTDNLIISAFININTVGFYSNYLTVINLLNTFIMMIYNGITASLGNLIVRESYEKKEQIFKIMNFLAFIIYGYCAVCLINLFNIFINIWIGEKYCLEFPIVLMIIINFYLTGMRVPSGIMKSAAGLFDVDKFTPLIQAIINLIVSIILVQKIGLIGVLIGTFISSIVIPCWQRPYLVYKYVLKKSSKQYFIEYLKNIIIIVISTSISLFINNNLKINSLITAFIIKGIISTIVFFAISYMSYRKSETFTSMIKYVKQFYERRPTMKSQ